MVIHGFIYSHKDMKVNKFRIPNIKHFIKGESGGKLSKDKHCSVLILMVNAGKWGVKTKKWMRCQLAIA